MLSDKTKEFIKEHEQPQGKTLYKLENGKKKAVSRWIDSTVAEMACEIERKEFVKKACEIFKKQIEEANAIIYNMEKYSNYSYREYFKNVFDVEGSLADFKRELEENL